MKQLMNRVQLIGNLGRDPELITTANGRALVKVSLATNEIYKKADGEKVTETSWHNLVAWGPLAETMSNLLQKGNRVAVQGKLKNRTYEDKEGQRKYITEVIVDDFMRLSRPAEAPAQESEALPF